MQADVVAVGVRDLAVGLDGDLLAEDTEQGLLVR